MIGGAFMRQEYDRTGFLQLPVGHRGDTPPNPQPLLSKDGTPSNVFRTVTVQPRPEYGHDCLTCAIFGGVVTRQEHDRTGYLQLLLGCRGAFPAPPAYLSLCCSLSVSLSLSLSPSLSLSLSLALARLFSRSISLSRSLSLSLFLSLARSLARSFTTSLSRSLSHSFVLSLH